MARNQYDKAEFDLLFMEQLRAPFSDLNGFLQPETSHSELTNFDPESLMEQFLRNQATYYSLPKEMLTDLLILVSFDKLHSDKPKKVNMNNPPPYQCTHKYLTSRYKVQDKCTGPDCITFLRLRLMFPHFCFLYPDGRARFDVSSSANIYKLVQQREFAGLIPDVSASELFMEANTQSDLILIHLLSSIRLQPLLSHDEIFKLFKLHHKKSLLSNERRAKFLENLGVITGGILGPEMQIILKEMEHWRNSTAYQTYMADLKPEIEGAISPGSQNKRPLKEPQNKRLKAKKVK